MFKFHGVRTFIRKSIVLLLIVSGTAIAQEKKEKQNIDLPPWAEIQNRLSFLESKMQAKKDNINKLIEEKQSLPQNSPKVKGVIENLIKEYKELQKMQQDYDKEMTAYKFRYPEKGAKKNRVYEQTEIKSIDDLEKELSVDGRLTRNMKKLRSLYIDEEEEKKKLENQKAGEKVEKSIEEAGSIILKK